MFYGETHLGTPSNTAIVATEGDALVFDHDVPQVLVSLADVHAFDGLGCLTGVLVGQNIAAIQATLVIEVNVYFYTSYNVHIEATGEKRVQFKY